MRQTLLLLLLLSSSSSSSSSSSAGAPTFNDELFHDGRFDPRGMGVYLLNSTVGGEVGQFTIESLNRTFAPTVGYFVNASQPGPAFDVSASFSNLRPPGVVHGRVVKSSPDSNPIVEWLPQGEGAVVVWSPGPFPPPSPVPNCSWHSQIFHTAYSGIRPARLVFELTLNENGTVTIICLNGTFRPTVASATPYPDFGVLSLSAVFTDMGRLNASVDDCNVLVWQGADGQFLETWQAGPVPPPGPPPPAKCNEQYSATACDSLTPGSGNNTHRCAWCVAPWDTLCFDIDGSKSLDPAVWKCV